MIKRVVKESAKQMIKCYFLLILITWSDIILQWWETWRM